MALSREIDSRSTPGALYAYEAYGLVIASELELAGLRAAPAGHAAPEVSIRLGTVDPELPDAVVCAGYFSTAAAAFQLDIASAARYRVREGREIVVDPYPETDPARVRLFLLGSALGALLYQRRLLLLHGSALDTPWGTMVFVGAQGEGKSTLAAHLHRRGYALRSDDVCAVTRGAAGGFEAQPALPLMRLCEDALAQLEGLPGHAREATFDVDKFVVALRQPGVAGASRITAVHLLTSHEDAEITLCPMRGFDRMNLLMGNLYRPEYLRGMASAGEVMRVAAALVAETPVYEVRRPRDIARMDEILDLLETQWRGMPRMDGEHTD